jgi:sulfotransferase
MKKLVLLSGMPRSGSTLLCNLINQNKEFYATPTSGLLEILANMRKTFSHSHNFKGRDRMGIYKDFSNGLEGFINGFYSTNNVVFDKNRLWPSQFTFLDHILKDGNTKVIWTYRNPVDVLNSIEKQYFKTILLENIDEQQAPNQFFTQERRVEHMCGDNSFVATPVFALDDAVKLGYENRIFLLDYNNFVKDPQKVMDLVHDFIGENRHQYDVDNVTQNTFEFDGVYNYKFLHTIKEGKIEPQTSMNVLQPNMVDYINTRFSWLNEFSGKKIKEIYN